MLKGMTKLLVLVLLGVFLLLGYWGSRNRSATFDEPLHFAGAWEHYHDGDFRVDVEDPPLWQYWAVLGSDKASLWLSHVHPYWRAICQDHRAAGEWSQGALYLNRDNNVAAAFAAAHLRMLALGAGLALLIGVWGWQIGGQWAGMLAMSLFGFDPTFLGHSPLVKNDVVFTLLWCAVAFSLYRVGRAARWPGLLALVVLPGMALSSKFSGLLVFPVVGLCLFARCCIHQRWPFLRRSLKTFGTRLMASVLLMGCTVVVAWVIIWASYQFRYGPSPDPDVWLSEQSFVDMDAGRRLFAVSHQAATVKAAEMLDPVLAVKAAVWCSQHHLLPQAFCCGFIYTHASVICRMSFLCGEIQDLGWWDYFPAAMLFKTPLATLAMGVVGIPIIGLILVRRGNRRPPLPQPSPGVPGEGESWAAICLLLPAAFYLAMAMYARFNIGFRHILPIYPLLYVATAWGMIRLVQRWPKWLATAVPVLLVAGLAAETLVACPNFIPFFNVACGGWRGGIRLLGDSNLDWGQDLPALAAWQRQNPKVQLYLCYFGRARPEYYGIQFINANLNIDEDEPLPTAPGILAISATYLQGMYLTDAKRALIAPLRQQKPLAILGGSIYLYPWPLPSAAKG